jgi:hypothetical protein
MRWMIAGVAAGAAALSGLVSVVAAQAFKGHSTSASRTKHARTAAPRPVRVPAPQHVPSIAGAPPAPLQPPAQPPAAAVPQPAAPAPQVSGGS